MTSDVMIKNSRNKFYGRYSDEIDSEDITVVIPTLNEALGIGQVIESVFNAGYYNVLIVDGYSSDNTVEVAKEYKVKILMQHGKGKTGALKTCIEHVETPYFIVMDGDATYDPKDIAQFKPHMKFYNQIIGVRTSGREKITKLNRFGNWVINKCFNMMFGTKLTDVCSGLYCLNTEFARGLILNTQGFDVEVEIAAQAADSGSITQVPITFAERIGIQKLNPFKDGAKILLAIFKLARIYNAVILYSFISALTIVPAFLILSWVLFEALAGTWHNGIALIGVLLSVLATQAFTISTIASQQRRSEQRLLQKLKGKKF